MKLPKEDVVRAAIRQRIKPELDLASEILDLAAEIFTQDKEVEAADGLDQLVVIVALGLLAKSCKQYRAGGELVEMGLGEVAESVSHMLFETMLAVNFLLRRRIVLKYEVSHQTLSGERRHQRPEVRQRP